MKLELKHLTPYLPYNIEISINNFMSDSVGIQRAKINGYYFLGENPHFTYKGGSAGKSFSEFKPILEPLDINVISNDYTWNEWKFFFKQHFAVFGLIPKGLAIDKNTI